MGLPGLGRLTFGRSLPNIRMPFPGMRQLEPQAPGRMTLSALGQEPQMALPTASTRKPKIPKGMK